MATPPNGTALLRVCTSQPGGSGRSADGEGGLGVFVLVVLACGVGISIAQRNWKWLTLPFTLLVFLAGNALGGAHELGSLGDLSKSLEAWRALDPETLLYIFLPPLLFVSALEVEYHIFRRLAWQAILLATVGVLICAGLIALVAIGMFDYGWGASEGLLFGAMFGATDPVAVVALLHELGAPETLSVLIEGESLLNDGVGFVLFEVFFEQLSGRADHSAAEIALLVCTSSFFGMLVGVGVGLLGLLAMQQVWEDSTLAVAISVICVWGCFFLAQLGGVSGVIAVVFLGLVFAAYADGYIQVEVKKSLVRFWKRVEYIVNVVLFALSGATVVSVLSGGAEYGGQYQTTARDFVNLGILFIMINVIRLVCVAVLFKPLQGLGYGMSWRRALVVSYAGLRGAVGLIGALLVVDECTCVGDVRDESAGEDGACLVFATQHRMIFHMCGIVLLTLLVNGTTSKALLHFLDLDKQSEAAQTFFEKATVHVHEHMDFVIESLKRHPYYKSADWDEVWRHVPILSRQVYNERKKKGLEHNRDSFALLRQIDKVATSRFAASPPTPVCVDKSSSSNSHPDVDVETGTVARGAGALAKSGTSSDNSSDMNHHLPPSAGVRDASASEVEAFEAAQEDQQLREARYRFLNLVKASYRHQFEEGANRSWPAMQVLIEAASRCQDHPGRPLSEWADSIQQYVGSADTLTARIRRCRIQSRAAHLAASYNVAATFVRAHKSVVGPFRHFVHETTAAIVDAVLAENASELRRAMGFTEFVEREHPEVAASVKTNIAIQRLLREMESYAQRMLARAEIDERDLETIAHALEDSRRDLNKHLRGRADMTVEQVVKNCPLFLDVAPDLVELALAVSRVRPAPAGEVLFSRDAGELHGEEVYLVVRGKVQLRFDDGTELEKSPGDVLGVTEFVTEGAFTDRAVCESTVDVVAFSYSLLRDLSRQSAQLRDNLTREAGLGVLEAHYPQFQFASFNLLKSVLPHVRIVRGGRRGSAPDPAHPRRPSVVVQDKPIFFHGGVVIGLRGDIAMVDGRSRHALPMVSVQRAHVPLALSDDAVLMYLSADAVADIEEYVSAAPRPVVSTVQLRPRKPGRNDGDGGGRARAGSSVSLTTGLRALRKMRSPGGALLRWGGRARAGRGSGGGGGSSLQLDSEFVRAAAGDSGDEDEDSSAVAVPAHAHSAPASPGTAAKAGATSARGVRARGSRVGSRASRLRVESREDDRRDDGDDGEEEEEAASVVSYDSAKM